MSGKIPRNNGGGGGSAKTRNKSKNKNKSMQKVNIYTAHPETAYDSDKKVKEDQLWESIYEWLDPPELSTNHDTGTKHKGTAAWFIEGDMFQDWKTTGSLLWVHGKLGSGKSVLCSRIIENIEALSNGGHASVSMAYFNFRNVNEQHRDTRGLTSSFLSQLSAHSPPRYDILSGLYKAHDSGNILPSDLALVNCLRLMFSLPDQRPIYLVMNALDECSDERPHTSEIPSPRERVLQLVEELVKLPHSNLRICATSHPEVDIRNVLEPLASLRFSLHDHAGQKQAILDYIESTVYSKAFMKNCTKEQKEHVVKTLSERADGMFLWVDFQLQLLHDCIPQDLEHILKRLPESLNETYERIFKDIKESKRNAAHRIFQCLVVAVRPLRVEELAEVLAINFDGPEGMPKLEPRWRLKDAEPELLSLCSGFIAIVSRGDSRVVQFTHSSVKEFLTSSLLDVPGYPIDLQSAHTILGQACLAVLLPSRNGIRKTSPLAEYAARHWATHAQFEGVLLDLPKPMKHSLGPHEIDIDLTGGTRRKRRKTSSQSTP